MWKLVVLFSVVVFLPCLSPDKPSLALAIENPTEIEDRLITDCGVIVRDMPKENLANAGFSEDKLISHNLSGNQEYLTFLDITLVGDNITFYLEDGKVKDWFRGTSIGTLEEGN